MDGSVLIGSLLWWVLHTVAPTHPCHLLDAGPWQTTLTVDYARTDTNGAYMMASTTDHCVCLVRVEAGLLHTEPDVLSGRAFIAAGRVVEGEVVLEKVCLTYRECQP